VEFGFFVCYVTMRACLDNFRTTLPGPGPQANAKFFSLNVVLDSWEGPEFSMRCAHISCQ